MSMRTRLRILFSLFSFGIQAHPLKGGLTFFGLTLAFAYTAFLSFSLAFTVTFSVSLALRRRFSTSCGLKCRCCVPCAS